jgi:MoaA/NifB/PqqE/SkfB family radical SAM enzyme
MTTQDLTSYLNRGIRTIFATVRKKTLPDFRELSFLLQAGYSARRTARKRLVSERNGVHIPAFLIASITDSCNLFCKGCYARANNICGSKETANGRVLLTAEQWESVFSQAEKLGISFCLLAGGEPMLRADVLDYAAGHRHMIFPVFTNGTLFTRDKILFFDQRRNMIPVISMEGNEETTDRRRGTGTFGKLQETADAFLEKHLLWGSSITVTTENIREITAPLFIRQLYNRGCRIIFYIEYVPVVPGSEALAPQEREREELSAAVERIRTTFKGLLLLSFPGDEAYMGGCLAGGRGFFHINPYGDAEPCPFSPYSDTNVTRKPLHDVLKSPLFTRLSEESLTGTEHSGGCALFEQRSKIAGLLVKRENYE